jgi:polar amino acid transport system substrate-binding protein
MKSTSFKLLLLSLCFISQIAQAEKSLKLATDNWPPYEYYLDNNPKNKIIGYSTEIMERVLGNMKIKIASNRIVPWARGENMVFNGKVDVLYSSSPSEKRRNACFLTEEPLIDSIWVLFIRKADVKRLKFEKFSDLDGKKVGVVREYSYTTEFWDYLKSKGKFETVVQDKQNFAKLNRKRIDYVACEYGNGLALLKKMGLENDVVAITNNPLKKVGLYPLFSKKTVDKKTVDEFSKALKSFKTTPEYKKIYETYFGSGN